jgi:phosphohistidine swiveling domain-containing protein
MKDIEDALIDHAKHIRLDPPDLILFATPDEIQKSDLAESRLLDRKCEYESLMKWALPARLHSSPDLPPPGLLTLSPGEASGILVDERELMKKIESGDTRSPCILWIELLDPALYRYFPHVKGIVSLQGGLLSHLAILAREAGIPVWSGFAPGPDLPLGSRIQVSNTGGSPVIRMDSSRINP